MYRVSNFIRSEARLGCGGGYTRGNPLLAFNSSAKETHRRPLGDLLAEAHRCPSISIAATCMFLRETESP